MANVIGTLQLLSGWWLRLFEASPPSSTTKMVISVSDAPRARIEVKAACPGVVQEGNLRHFQRFGRHRYAEWSHQLHLSPRELRRVSKGLSYHGQRPMMTTGGRSTNSSDSSKSIFNEEASDIGIVHLTFLQFHNPPSRVQSYLQSSDCLSRHDSHHKEFLDDFSRFTLDPFCDFATVIPSVYSNSLIIPMEFTLCYWFWSTHGCSFLFYSSYCYSSYYFSDFTLILTSFDSFVVFLTIFFTIKIIAFLIWSHLFLPTCIDLSWSSGNNCFRRFSTAGSCTSAFTSGASTRFRRCWFLPAFAAVIQRISHFHVRTQHVVQLSVPSCTRWNQLLVPLLGLSTTSLTWSVIATIRSLISVVHFVWSLISIVTISIVLAIAFDGYLVAFCVQLALLHVLLRSALKLRLFGLTAWCYCFCLSCSSFLRRFLFSLRQPLSWQPLSATFFSTVSFFAAKLLINSFSATSVSTRCITLDVKTQFFRTSDDFISLPNSLAISV